MADINAGITKATIGVRGGFTSVTGIGYGDNLAERTANATEQTAKNTSKLLKQKQEVRVFV
jgi:hypothetical protein